jgi:hypothetical protein
MPSGKVGADGGFTLRTYDSETQTVHDGAPPGPYIVTITWLPEKVLKMYRDKGATEIPQVLDARYMDATTSPLRAEVKQQPNELPAFQLPQAAYKGPK